MKEYLDLILTFLGGSFVTGLLGFFISRRKENRNDFQTLVQEYQKLAQKAVEAEHKCEEQLEEVKQQVSLHKEEISQLKTQIILLESANNHMPFPMWLKDMQFKMLYVNREYEKDFLFPLGLKASDYIGKYDDDIWPSDVAKSFRENDMQAISMRTTNWQGIEELPNGRKIRVVKWIRFIGGAPIGVAGLALPHI